jgi:hypothetical protein
MKHDRPLSKWPAWQVYTNFSHVPRELNDRDLVKVARYIAFSKYDHTIRVEEYDARVLRELFRRFGKRFQ